MRYRLIKANKVENIIEANPDFISKIISEWDAIEPDTGDTSIGAVFDGDVWVEPVVPENPATPVIEAMQAVDSKLSKTLYDLTSFIKNKFLLDQAQIDQITAMTTVAQLRAVILDRFSLTQGQQDYIENFRAAYEAWIAVKG